MNLLLSIRAIFDPGKFLRLRNKKQTSPKPHSEPEANMTKANERESSNDITEHEIVIITYWIANPG
jgi:hypothetical protein